MLRMTEKTIPPKATAFEGILIYTMLKSFTPAVYVYIHSSVFKQILCPPHICLYALFSIQTDFMPATPYGMWRLLLGGNNQIFTLCLGNKHLIQPRGRMASRAFI